VNLRREGKPGGAAKETRRDASRSRFWSCFFMVRDRGVVRQGGMRGERKRRIRGEIEGTTDLPGKIWGEVKTVISLDIGGCRADRMK